MRTPSLRRRAVLWSVAVLATLLLAVGVFVDLTLGAILKADARTRLVSIASLSAQLQGTLSGQDLADRLSVPGITVTVRAASGSTVVGVPSAPPAGSGPGGPKATPRAAPKSAESKVSVSEQPGRLVATESLSDGSTVTLTADTTTIDVALARFRTLMTVGSAAAVVLAAVLLWLVLGRALRPLDALTRAARATAGGDRGRRLGARNPRTELGRAADAFDAMLEELEGAERAADDARTRLSRFLSDASHELRTPLAGVSAGAERLLLDQLTAAAREELAAELVRESRRAGRLVDDLLTVSRLEEITLDRQVLSLGSLVATAVARTERIVPAVAIDLRDDADLDTWIDADPMRIEQIFANLLQNAARAAGPGGRIRIRIDCVGKTARVTVSDSGPGVPEEAREAIFARLVRLDAARASSSGGAGLGLPIARGLAEAHGGQLTCAPPSAEDLPGAAFVVVLPTAAHPAVLPTRVLSHAGAAALSRSEGELRPIPSPRGSNRSS